MDVHEAIFIVRTSECRPDGKIRIASLMQYLQEAAALHAERLGVGFETLREMDAYWVLSNFRIDITRLPVWSEHVTIRTWPSGYNRVVASREFVGKDRDGRELFRAGSEWMILDKQRNRPKNLFRLDLSLPKTGEKVLLEKLSRLQPHSEYRAVDRVRVPYSSIDLNGHVNNTEYVRWGFDALRRAFPVEGDIRCVQVTYLSEVFEDAELNMLVACGADGDFYVLGRKPDAKTDVYIMEVRL
jgi:medium-chain acyl-[acyl-carrier-protein] hydrolase